MREVDWSNFNPEDRKHKANGGITFLKFQRDKSHRVRPFGSCVEFYKIFVEKGKPSIVVDPDTKDEAARILSEHLGREVRPSYRNAMFVINREDQKVYVMEFGYQVSEAFANWSSSTGIKPGAGQAGDWNIKVTGDGVGGSNPRKYNPVYMGPALFSDEEKKMISEWKAADKLKLENYLKETPLSNILAAAGLETSNSEQVAVGATAGSEDDMEW